MASSVIEICNNALLMLGDVTITTFSENIPAAKLCSNLWPVTRDAVLRLHPWNCAVKRVTLAPKAEAPVYGYSKAFTVPAELLRLLEVDGLTDYKIEGRDIVCNASGISIRYIFRNEDVNSYDALLVEVLQAYMTYKLAYPITKSSTVRSETWEMFKNLLPVARNIDAQEEPQDTLGDFSLLNVRG